MTVAVLDTGINSLLPDLAGRVVQEENVKLFDMQSMPAGFLNPAPDRRLLPNARIYSKAMARSFPA